MAENDAVFKFGADTSEVEKSIEGLGSQIASFGKTAGLAIGGFFAASKMIDFFNGATEAAVESEKAVKQFNFTLKAAGVFSEEASKGFQNYAASLQKVTGIQDEAILSGASTLISIGELSGNELNRTVVASLDLAAARGLDVATAFEMMARAAQGNVMPFAKLGVEFKNNASDAEKFAQVLGFIESKMTGAAQENLKGYSGAVLELKNAWADFLEDAGNVIISSDATTGAIKMLTEAISFMRWLIIYTVASTKMLGAELVYLGSVFASVTQGILLLDFNRIKTGIDAAGSAMAASKQATTDWYNSFAELNNQMTTSTIPNFEKKAKAVEKTKEELLAAKQALEYLRGAQEEFENTQFFAGFIKGLRSMQLTMAQVGGIFAKNFVGGLTNGFAAIGAAIVKGENAMDAFGKAMLSAFGAALVQMGQGFIALGIAQLFTIGMAAQGAALIAAGAGVVVAGGVLQALGGGGSGTAAASATTAGANYAVTDTSQNNEDLFSQTPEQEREKARTGVTINVQGNILDRRETGLELAEILNSAFDTNGTLVRANA